MMKKLFLYTFIGLLVLTSVLAQQDPAKIATGFTWLVEHSSNGNYGNDIQTTAFATLALKEAGALDYAQLGFDYIRSLEDSQHCWPRGNCDVTSTAFAAWVLNEYGEDTVDAEAWLKKALTPALKDNWWLEVVTSNNGVCKISYATKGNDTTQKDVQVDAGTFPTCKRNFPSTFFDLNTCLESALLDKNPSLELDINCNDLGPNTIISVIYNSGSDYYLIKEAAASRDIITIENGCFGKKSGGSCSTDTTLFSQWILTQMGSDVSALLWLKNNYDEFRAVDNSLLYLASTDKVKDTYLQALLDLQRNDGSFNKQVYDTSIAILALKQAGSSEAQLSEDWLASRQSADGSWENNLLRTAIALYSSFTDVGLSLPPIGILHPTDQPLGFCGDKTCDPGEESFCPADCPSQVCVTNGLCESSLGETAKNCATDCSCGDSICDSSESSFSCPSDCGSGPQEEGICGNNIIEGSEQCDGSDDAACSGNCQSNCLCGEDSGFPWWVPIVIVVLLAGVIFAYYRSRKKETGKPTTAKPFFKPFTSQLERRPTQPSLPPRQQQERRSLVEDELDKSLEEAKKLLKKIS